MSSPLEDRGRLELAMAGTRLGLWDWDMVTGETVFNERWAEIVGYTLDELQPTTIETWMTFAHPDDLEASNAAISAHVAGQVPYYDVEARMRHKDGHWVWVHDRGRVVEWTESGEPARMVGTHEDISDKQAMVEALQASERRFAAMFGSEAAIMLVINPDTGAIVDANPPAAAFYGLDLAELTGQRLQDFCIEAGEDGSNCAVQTGLAVHRNARGQERTVEVYASPIVTEDRPLVYAIVHDVTERETSARRLREAATVFENALEGIVLVDADGFITAINPAFTRLTDWLPEEVIGRPLTFLEAVGSVSSEDTRLADALHHEEGYRGQHRIWRADGAFRDVQFSLSVVHDDEGHSLGWVAQMADLGDRIRAEQVRLDNVLHYDRTTGLPNRSLFLDRLAMELRSLRRSQHTSALLLLNLDDFKRINEAYGFEGGEAVVRVIAERLSLLMRPGDMLARQAGDEFAILLSGIRSRAEAAAVAGRLLGALDSVVTVPHVGALYVTACVGAVLLPEGIDSADEATQFASTALHAAKNSGPGSVHFHSEDFVPESRDRLVRVAQLRQGWLDGEFHLAYQPYWNVGSGEMTGVEALMRWTSPILGTVAPSEFIPLAEDVGLIEEMGTWALREACRQGAAWASAGVKELSISVNVTAVQLTSGTMTAVVRDALASTGLPPDRLTLELTESALLHPTRATTDVLRGLADEGVRLAIDDFGTGYSSFAYLRQYPLDTLKIDRAFIADMADDPGARSIVAAIIDVGHHLGLRVLAEGVEDTRQLAALQDLGCDEYQGFLSSAAVSPKELQDLAIASL